MTTLSLLQRGRWLTVWLGLALLGLVTAPVAQAQAPNWPLVLPYQSVGLNTAVKLVVDAQGNSYMAGAVNSSATPSAVRLGSTLVSPNDFIDGYLAKISPTGAWLWVLPFTGFGDQAPLGLTLDPAGNVYVSGMFQPTDFTLGSLTVTHPSGTAFAGFVVKVSSTGQPQWAATTLGAFGQVVYDAVANNLVTAGVYYANAGYPARIGSVMLPVPATAGTATLYVARLSLSGQWGAVTTAGGNYSGSLSLNDVAVGPQGQVYAMGNITGPAYFGSTLLSGGTATLYVAQLGSSGTWQWARQVVGAVNVYSATAPYFPTMAVDANGLVTVGGRMSGTTAVFGSTTLTGPDCGYAARINAAGQWLWAQQTRPAAGGTSSAQVRAIVPDGRGNVLLLGGTSGSQLLGTTTLTNQCFVAGLGPNGQWQTVTAPSAGAGSTFCLGALAPGGTLVVQGTTPVPISFGGLTLPAVGNNFLAWLANALGPLAARPMVAAPGLAVWPTPSHGTATLRLPAHPGPAVVVSDALGRPVRRQPVPALAEEFSLDLAGLAPGLYVVQCGTASGRLVVE